MFCATAPQRGILTHPVPERFLSECQISLVDEAVNYDVPLLAIDGNHQLVSKQAEAAGIARTHSHKRIDALETCAAIGYFILLKTYMDIVGTM